MDEQAALAVGGRCRGVRGGKTTAAAQGRSQNSAKNFHVMIPLQVTFQLDAALGKTT